MGPCQAGHVPGPPLKVVGPCLLPHADGVSGRARARPSIEGGGDEVGVAEPLAESGRARARPSIEGVTRPDMVRNSMDRQAGHVPGPPLKVFHWGWGAGRCWCQAGHVPGPPLKASMTLRAQVSGDPVRPGTCPALH